ncbi:hypothetical protein JYB55_02370 [Mycolicibacterium septicum]|nr:hypothetical protein [Mycolicibacterium septicum]
MPGANEPGGREYNEAYYYGFKKTGNEGTAIKFAQWYMTHCVGRTTPKDSWRQAPDWMTAPSSR